MSTFELHEKKKTTDITANTLTLLSALASGLFMAVFAMAVPAWIIISS